MKTENGKERKEKPNLQGYIHCMPKGKVSFVMRLSPLQPGYVMTVCDVTNAAPARVRSVVGIMVELWGVETNVAQKENKEKEQRGSLVSRVCLSRLPPDDELGVDVVGSPRAGNAPRSLRDFFPSFNSLFLYSSAVVLVAPGRGKREQNKEG